MTKQGCYADSETEEDLSSYCSTCELTTPSDSSASSCGGVTSSESDSTASEIIPEIEIPDINIESPTEEDRSTGENSTGSEKSGEQVKEKHEKPIVASRSSSELLSKFDVGSPNFFIPAMATNISKVPSAEVENEIEVTDGNSCIERFIKTFCGGW